jgi:predicted nucleic acid-binding protein
VRTSTPSPAKTQTPVPELHSGPGLLDTSVLVAPRISAFLPTDTSIATLSLAELAAGPRAATDAAERGRRQEHLQLVEAMYDPLPFDTACARAYGRVYGAVAATGRKARGRRAVDLLIAATALAHDLPLYTRNAGDLQGLDQILEIVDCAP